MFSGPELFPTFLSVGVLMRNVSKNSADDLFADSSDNLLWLDCWCSLGVPVEGVVVLPSWESLERLRGMFG